MSLFNLLAGLFNQLSQKSPGWVFWSILRERTKHDESFFFFPSLSVLGSNGLLPSIYDSLPLV